VGIERFRGAHGGYLRRKKQGASRTAAQGEEGALGGGGSEGNVVDLNYFALRSAASTRPQPRPASLPE